MSEQVESTSNEQKAGGAPVSGSGGEDLSLVMDVPVTLKVMLGEAALTIGDILKCGKGSVIPLSQKVGDPFVVTLQKKPIAEGEIVQAGDHFGIKITNVIKN